jgi:hypothetical protein
MRLSTVIFPALYAHNSMIMDDKTLFEEIFSSMRVGE